MYFGAPFWERIFLVKASPKPVSQFKAMFSGFRFGTAFFGLQSSFEGFWDQVDSRKLGLHLSFQGFLFSFCDPHLQYYLYMIIVATCETPRTFILSLTPVEAKAAEPEEPVQDDEPSTETDNDGQGGDENEQSDDHEHDDQDVDDDDQTQSMDDNHDHSQDVGGDDQSDDDDDDGQSQSQDVGDNGVEGSQDMGESQPGSCDGESDSEKTLVLPGRGEDPAPSPMEDSPRSPSAAAQTDVESGSSSVHSISTPDRKTSGSWNEEFFTTPMFGNSGPRRSEIVEMCMALMQYFGSNHPDIMKPLSLYLR